MTAKMQIQLVWMPCLANIEQQLVSLAFLSTSSPSCESLLATKTTALLWFEGRIVLCNRSIEISKSNCSRISFTGSPCCLIQLCFVGNFLKSWFRLRISTITGEEPFLRDLFTRICKQGANCHNEDRKYTQRKFLWDEVVNNNAIRHLFRGIVRIKWKN